MATPIMTLPEWTAAQASPWITMMTALRRLEGYGQSAIVVENVTLNTPPGSPSAGQMYFIASSPTGAWSGQAQRIALYTGSSWEFQLPRRGWLLFSLHNNTHYIVNGSGGVDAVVIPTTTQFNNLSLLDVITTTDTAYVPLLSNGTKQYIRQTGSVTADFVLPQDSAQAFPVGSALTFEQSGTGLTAIIAGTGATVHSRGGALEFAGQYAVATAVKKSANTWTVTGDLVV